MENWRNGEIGGLMQIYLFSDNYTKIIVNKKMKSPNLQNGELEKWRNSPNGKI